MTADYPLTGPEAIEHALSRIDLDELEAEQRQVITSKKKTARPRAVRLLGIIAGLRKNQVGAGELMLKSVPVIPPKFRPFSVTGDTFLPGDANEMYRDLLEYRRLYQKTEESLGREGSGEVYGDLVKAVRAAYGFGDSPNPKTHARGVKGFFQTVTGTSPKTGFFQSKMLSKPVDTVARGVIIPDADYDMNEIGIPAEHAWKLYGSYIQRRLVRSGLAPAAALRHVKERTPQALKALESEMAGRPVVATRSPAWHKFNVIGANPRIVEGDAIRINTWVTDGLTADFNGDSVSGCTSITYMISGRVFQSSFSEFAERIVGKTVDEMVDEAASYTRVYRLTPDMIQVLTVDDRLRPAWAPADEITVHTSHGSCYDVHTHTGKRVTATEHHNFTFLSDALDLVTMKTEDMLDGDSLFLPAVYNFAPVDAPPVTLLIGDEFNIPLDTDFAWLLGFFAAEGSVTSRDMTFCVTEADYFAKTKRIMFEAFGTDNAPQSTTLHKDCILREYRNRITRWFEATCGKGFAGKVVPSFIFTAPREIIMAYFYGVLDGDGSVTSAATVDKVDSLGKGRTGSVRIAMKNRAFLEALSGLMASVGVRTFLKQDAKSSTLTVATGDHTKLLAVDLESRKLDQIRHLVETCKPVERDRHDIIPLPESVLSLVRGAAATLRHPSKEARAARAAWQDGRPGKSVVRLTDALGRGQQHLSRSTATDYIFSFGSELQDSLLFRRWISIVENTDLQWERVSQVARVEREDVTFDVAVPRGRELFAVAGNLLVHNTMSVHLPSTDAAVKDVRERMMPDKMLWSVKDRDKVVPSPKHEQMIGLNLGGTKSIKNKHTFVNEADAMRAIESGQVDLNDDIDINPSYVPAAPTFTPGSIDR